MGCFAPPLGVNNIGLTLFGWEGIGNVDSYEYGDTA